MNNWKEYIEQTFYPLSDYNIEDKTQVGQTGIYSLTHKQTGTSFAFIYPYKDWKKVDDVQYNNPKTKAWSGEFTEAEFNETERERLDEFLRPAMYDGWSSKDFYIFGNHFHSKVYWNKNFDGMYFRYYTGFGCLWFILFPLFWLIIRLMELKLIRGMKKVVIEPTNKSID